MVDVYKRLSELGITLPQPGGPAAAYVMAVQTGNLVYTAGHIAKQDGEPWVGQLGRDMTTVEGQQAARSVAIDLLSTLHVTLGDLNRIRRIVKVLVLVSSTSEFREHHVVANGCSELLLAVFGEAGRHARSAFGAPQLPRGACVEIELIAEV